jgi:hypothetical protein
MYKISTPGLPAVRIQPIPEEDCFPLTNIMNTAKLSACWRFARKHMSYIHRQKCPMGY